MCNQDHSRTATDDDVQKIVDFLYDPTYGQDAAVVMGSALVLLLSGGPRGAQGLHVDSLDYQNETVAARTLEDLGALTRSGMYLQLTDLGLLAQFVATQPPA